MKSVYGLNIITGEGHWFPSTAKASKWAGTNTQNVRDVLKNKYRHSANGFTFGYSVEDALSEKEKVLSNKVDQEKFDMLEESILYWYFKKGESYERIAARYGITLYRVRKIVLASNVQ